MLIVYFLFSSFRLEGPLPAGCPGVPSPGPEGRIGPRWRERAAGKGGRLSLKLPGPILTVSSALRVEHWLINVNSCSGDVGDRTVNLRHLVRRTLTRGRARGKGGRSTVDGFLTKVLNVYYMYICIYVCMSCVFRMSNRFSEIPQLRVTFPFASRFRP